MADFEIIDMKAIQNKIKNVQLCPSNIRVEINDKAAKTLFKFDTKIYETLRNGAPFNIIETDDNPKYGKIVTPYSIISPYAEPLNEFDRDVLGVCTGEYLAGNQYTTVSIIFRALIGKVGNQNIRPQKKQKEAIIKSIDKLLATTVSFDTTESFKALNYDNVVKTVKSAILPSCRIEATINGQKADVIYFDRISPLFDTANAKNQIVRYPAALLDVPNQNNTPRIIAVKNYVMRRIAEIKIHKMTPTITFEDIFAKCSLSNTDKKTQLRVRESLAELFKHLQSQNFISAFTLRKKDMGNGFYGFTFSYQK